MVRGRVGVLVAWCLLLFGGLWQTTAAQLDGSHTYNHLPFLVNQPRELIEDSGNNQPSTAEGLTVEGREKRVFLSRGWGPGGYEAPRPVQSPSHRFVRRPPSPPPPPEQHATGQKLKPSNTGLGLGGARFAALVSMARQRSSPSQPKANQRRFHSIFTSGTWRPLGKRSPYPYPLELSAYKATDDDSQSLLLGSQNDEDRTTLSSLDENLSWTGYQDTEQGLSRRHTKRSGVFSSYGWGAGGSVTSPKHPWFSHTSAINWKPSFDPITTGLTRWNGKSSGDTNATSGDRHTASFREGAPLFHLFLSRGWGPMGR